MNNQVSGHIFASLRSKRKKYAAARERWAGVVAPKVQRCVRNIEEGRCS